MQKFWWKIMAIWTLRRTMTHIQTAQPRELFNQRDHISLFFFLLRCSIELLCFTYSLLLKKLWFMWKHALNIERKLIFNIFRGKKRETIFFCQLGFSNEPIHFSPVIRNSIDFFSHCKHKQTNFQSHRLHRIFWSM